MNDNLEKEPIVVCEYNKRRKCDSYYIKENKQLKEVIDKAMLIIKGIAWGGSEDYYMEKISKINEALKEVKIDE